MSPRRTPGRPSDPLEPDAVLPHSIQLGPFTCEECAAEFPPLEGGICRRCRRTLCGRHLRPDPEADQSLPGGAMSCDACLASDPTGPRHDTPG